MKALLAAAGLTLALAAAAGPVRAAPADPTIGLFAQAAGTSNDFEIAESKIILQDSRSPAVRAFAARMIHDHAMAQQKLNQIGHMLGVPTAFVLGSTNQKKVDDLGLMDGATLDQTYIKDQIAAHADAAANLEGYLSTGTNPALLAYARHTLPVVQMHQQLLMELTGQPQMM